MGHDPPEVSSAPKQPTHDGQWFAQALREHYGVLWSVARGVCGSAADADDILQDAVMIGWQKQETFELGTNFLAWMASITRNVARNHHRKNTRRQHASILDHDLPAPLESKPDTAVDRTTGQVQPDQQAFDDRVLRALGLLSATARACLLLRTVHGLDYQLIGEVMGIPKNTALSHVHRARQAMRGWLDETEYAKREGDKP